MHFPNVLFGKPMESKKQAETTQSTKENNTKQLINTSPDNTFGRQPGFKNNVMFPVEKQTNNKKHCSLFLGDRPSCQLHRDPW
jgi:hypothetical protein